MAHGAIAASASRVIDKRAANGFFSQATSGITGAPIIGGALKRQIAKDGGTWVGGRAELTDAYVSFAANALNRAVHDNPDRLCFTVPLQDIRAVRVRKAFGTDIIDVEAAAGVCTLRCFKAEAFAAAIRQAAGIR